jgi:hypothetical protein
MVQASSTARRSVARATLARVAAMSMPTNN